MPPGVEVEALPHGREPQFARLRAELGDAEGVFDLEHRLAGVEERLEQVALVVLEALLVERPVEVRLEFGRLGDRVLQTDGQAAGMRLVGDPDVPGD